MDYVVQRRFQTELMAKAGEGLGKIFDHLKDSTLEGLEAMTVLQAEKPIPKKAQDELCSGLLEIAREDGDTDTLSFEVVPYYESVLRGMKKEEILRAGGQLLGGLDG